MSAFELKEMVQTLISDFKKDIIRKDNFNTITTTETQSASSQAAYWVMNNQFLRGCILSNFRHPGEFEQHQRLKTYKLAYAFKNDIDLMCRQRFWEGDPQYQSILWETDPMRDEIYKELGELLGENGRQISLIESKAREKLENIAKDYKELTGKDFDERFYLGRLLHYKYEFPLSKEISKQYNELKNEYIQELLNEYLEFFKNIKTWFEEKDKITVESLVEISILIEDYEDNIEKDADKDTEEYVG